MRKPWLLVAVGVVPVLLSIAAVACEEEKSEEELTEQVCTDAAEFEGSLAELQATLTTPPVTVGDLQDQREQVASAWDNLVESSADLAEARFDDVEAAYEELDSAIGDISDDTTLAQALSSLVDELGAVLVAEQSFVAELNCP